MKTVYGQLPLEENCLPVRVGVLVKVRVNFRVGGEEQPDNCPGDKLVRLRVWARVSFRVWRQFSSGQLS